MSEHHIHVYRVTEVAEYHVDDDEIYEDDADMLRDVIEAADQGLLDFEAAEARFVAMAWNEENRMVVREVVGTEVAVKGGETYCEICLSKQFETPSGISCQRGHGGAGGISKTAANAERATRADARADRRGDDRAPSPRRKTTTRVPPGKRRSGSK